MRLLPRSRRASVAVAAGLAAAMLAVGWCDWYRPWEAHYKGRPTTWWGREITHLFQLYEGAWRPATAWWGWLESLGLLHPPPEELALFDGDPDAVPVLTALLASPKNTLRGAAVYGLAAVGPPARPALPKLLGLLEDGDEHIRLRAREAVLAIDPAALAAYDRGRPGAGREAGE